MGKWIDFARQTMRMGEKCVYCGREIPEGDPVCMECAREEEALCNHDGFIGGTLFAYRYGGIVRSLIHRFKYDDSPHVSLFMAQRMAEFLAPYDVNADMVTFVPIHETRKKIRGYDQSEFLALHLGMLLEIPGKAALVRVRETKPQYKLSAQERGRNVRGTFRLREDAEPKGKNILLIDDILTTGSTAGECMRTLTEAGANVMLFTYAREFPGQER